MRVTLTLLAVFLLPLAAHAACTSPAGDAGAVVFSQAAKTMQYCNGTNWVNTGKSEPAATQSGCTSPTGAAGAVVYNGALGVVQFCNGQNWVDTACATDRTPNGSGCSGKPAGAIQYVGGTVNELQFCDSTNWVAMGWGCIGSGGSTPPASCNHTTWTPYAPSLQWNGLASSADGTKLVATVYNGQIYTSTDSGATWVARATNRSWTGGIASSANGTVLAAIVEYGNVYISTNSGSSWTARASAQVWQDIAMSNDGTKMVAVATDGSQIYTSTDTGTTWTARESNRNWSSVASSSDGTKLVAVDYGGQIYTSVDSGVTWTARDSNRNWQTVASSADGTRLVAGIDGGQIYTSVDSGVTWTARDSNRRWWNTASSADGTKVFAASIIGQIYTSNCGGSAPADTTPPVWQTAATLPDGHDNPSKPGYNYNRYVSATDTGAITYSLQSGSLPTGLTLASNGYISGSPTVRQTATFTVRATDAAGNYADRAFTLTIQDGVPPVWQTAATLPETEAGSGNPYSVTFTATDAVSSVTYSQDYPMSPATPSGLSFNIGTRTLSGVPAYGTEGVYTLTLTATDAAGNPITRTFTLKINPNSAPGPE